jgi:hypothetical protein
MATEGYKGKLTNTPQISTDRNLQRLKVIMRIFFIMALLVIFAFWMDYWIRGELGMAKKTVLFLKSQWGLGALVAGGVIYILVLSLPFVPGVELGVLLMCAFGKEGIVFVYLATVSGLGLAFLFGRIVPQQWIRSILAKLGLSGFYGDASDGFETVTDQLTTIHKYLPRKVWSYFLRYRYLAIAVLVNLPGNYILGGGGGISLACGISPAISFKWFIVTVIIAVAPVPLLAYCGLIQLEAFLGI